jgi:hypothetical protein
VSDVTAHVERFVYAAVAIVDNHIELWDAEDNRLIRLTADQAQRIGLALMGAGQRVAGPTKDETLKNWRLR